jgi:hypothetical protein
MSTPKVVMATTGSEEDRVTFLSCPRRNRKGESFEVEYKGLRYMIFCERTYSGDCEAGMMFRGVESSEWGPVWRRSIKSDHWAELIQTLEECPSAVLVEWML